MKATLLLIPALCSISLLLSAVPGGFDYAIDVSSPGSVDLNVVPEPGTLSLAAVAFALLLVRPRRRGTQPQRPRHGHLRHTIEQQAMKNGHPLRAATTPGPAAMMILASALLLYLPATDAFGQLTLQWEDDVVGDWVDGGN